MKRVTIAYFTWDWQFLGKRAVNVSDVVMASKDLRHRFIVGLLRSVIPNPPADMHCSMVEGEPSEQDLLAAVEDLKAAHAGGTVPKTESWERLT